MVEGDEAERTVGVTVTAVPFDLKIRFEQLALDYKIKYGKGITLESLYLLALANGLPTLEGLEALTLEKTSKETQ